MLTHATPTQGHSKTGRPQLCVPGLGTSQTCGSETRGILSQEYPELGAPITHLPMPLPMAQAGRGSPALPALRHESIYCSGKVLFRCFLFSKRQLLGGWGSPHHTLCNPRFLQPAFVHRGCCPLHTVSIKDTERSPVWCLGTVSKGGKGVVSHIEVVLGLWCPRVVGITLGMGLGRVSAGQSLPWHSCVWGGRWQRQEHQLWCPVAMPGKAEEGDVWRNSGRQGWRWRK